jgi:hypothetical protein
VARTRTDAVVEMARDAAQIRCPWCGESVPAANVWICEADVIALCSACHRMSHAADGAPVAAARRRLFPKRRLRKPPVDA